MQGSCSASLPGFSFPALVIIIQQISFVLPFSLSFLPSGHSSRPVSQPHGDRSGKTLGRNPTIKISRATRVSEQWNASLDREITNANELRHLDEFLGNQVNSITESITDNTLFYSPYKHDTCRLFSTGQ